MDRLLAVITPWASAPATAPVWMAPGLMAKLGLHESQGYALQFGRRQMWSTVQPSPDLEPDGIRLSGRHARHLGLDFSVTLGIHRSGERIVLGPLLGLLIAQSKRDALLTGRQDPIYCQYARYAGEVGAQLLFFAVDDLEPTEGIIRGLRHECGADGCRWVPCTLPLPPVVYDRCFGKAGRAEAHTLRAIAQRLGMTVLNRPVKITKQQAFSLLGKYRELWAMLPTTMMLTPQSLAVAMRQYRDLYLKPNALYKGQGVYRLWRGGENWVLQTREDTGNTAIRLPLGSEVAAVMGSLGPDYLVQEGVDLATFHGNRYDFRALVQKDGRGQWELTGLVARIAPMESVITSPRSGGEVYAPELVLRHSFPDRWQEVLADLNRRSIQLAEGIERGLYPCTELGLDVGVTRDGVVKLIEVNGKPLKVSLARLRDPGVTERINRYPIHYAAYLALQGVEP